MRRGTATMSVLLHTMRVFYDMFEQEFPNPTPELLQHRALIQRSIRRR